MNDSSDVLEDLLRRSANVQDQDLMPIADTPAARALFEEIVLMPYEGTLGRLDVASTLRRTDRGSPRRSMRRRRFGQIALASALALAVVLSVPASGLVRHVKSWLSELKGADEPVPTEPDVVIASGVAGQPWTIIATQTDQGLCLFLLTDASGERSGLGGCGWGSDIHGYRAGGRGLHWVEGGNGSGHVGLFNRIITFGVAANKIASIDLELANGRTIPAQLVKRPKGIDPALNFFWAELGPQEGVELNEEGSVLEPRWPLVHALIARDAVGNVLERRIVDEPQG